MRPWTVAILIGVASCAAPMQLEVVCGNRLLMRADVVPGVTRMTGAMWQYAPKDCVPLGDGRCNVTIECRADYTPRSK